MFKRFLFLICITFALASCQHETVFTEVKVNDRYAILIPDYLQPCADLHKDASLQYQNVEKDIYAIVIDEKKITMQGYDLDYDLDLYFKSIASQPFLETIKDGKVSIPELRQIDGHKASVAEITGKIDGTEVYYKLAVVETDYEFYQLLVWTRAENKGKFETDMIKMIESFKELSHPKEELPQPKMSDSVSIVPTTS